MSKKQKTFIDDYYDTNAIFQRRCGSIRFGVVDEKNPPRLYAIPIAAKLGRPRDDGSYETFEVIEYVLRGIEHDRWIYLEE